jgi:predicted RecB family nuclease
MNKITNEILEGYLNCKTKGRLKVAGETGVISDYETTNSEVRQASREAALARLIDRFGEGDACREIAITARTLKQGASLLVDATLEDDAVSLRLDALRKADGASRLGGHHYLPLLHVHGDKVGRQQKMMLAMLGLMLDGVQGLRPAVGLVGRGPEGRLGKVRLDAKLYRQVQQVLDELKRLQHGTESPRLVLNGHCQVCEFRQRCREQAVREDNLSLLRGIGEKDIRNMARKGILTLTQLAHTFRPRRKGKRQERKSGRHYHALKALAIRDKRIYVLGAPTLPDGPVHAYLDIEGVPDEGFVYLVGLTVVGGDREERFSLWADDKGEEAGIYEQMLDVLGRHEAFVLFSYGSYEKAFLSRMAKQTSRKELADKVLKSLVNVLSVIHAHFYFPCCSNGLKDVAGHLGHTWADKDASGIQSLVWRSRWQTTGDEGWKQKLVAYNQDDLGALRRVADLIRGVIARTKQPPGTTADDLDLPPLGFVADLDELAQFRKKWGKVNYVHPDYEFINDCAYFDYQRERVFVRTSTGLRRRTRKQGKSPNSNVRVTAEITARSRQCPFCESEDLALVAAGEQIECGRPRIKRAFDLVITSTGIKRKVIECRARLQRCLACKRVFVPEEHQRLDKHFHGLKSWAMYQHVSHMLSLSTIEAMTEDLFGIRVTNPEVHMIKSMMADYYKPTYERLLAKILAGGLLHIDETEVKLKYEKGYVWVFTNLEEVVFMYRPTREGDFLKDLLKDFRGVLVSDFYAAYDSIGCPQQKCLIHLMRDMNHDLLANPFDEELKSVTGPFGTLLRAIVTTIDRHGLKRCHMKRHDREVEAFFNFLAGSTFVSDAAEALRTRLCKNRQKLFTFMQHDGVPWNNNNAENAIKRFAYYREDTAGTMKEQGLKDYLVLLSVCHTCRYKGVKFLKFLLSREVDIDAFCDARRQRRAAAGIEVYPAGFSHPHLSSLRRPKRPTTANDTQGQAAAAGENPQGAPSGGNA